MTIFPLIGVVLGFALLGYQIFTGTQSVTKNEYCSILNEQWTGGFDEGIWTKEVEVGGFG